MGVERRVATRIREAYMDLNVVWLERWGRGECVICSPVLIFSCYLSGSSRVVDPLVAVLWGAYGFGDGFACFACCVGKRSCEVISIVATCDSEGPKPHLELR